MPDEAIGTLVGRGEGQVIGVRILPPDGEVLRMEATARGGGEFLGQEMTRIVTYSTAARSDGSLYGEGNGLTVLKDGSMATFSGVGTAIQKGAMGPQHWKATVIHRNGTGKLASLNNRPLVTDFEVDENSKTHVKYFDLQ